MTIIGTRPQYIKIKPLYDYFKSKNINNILVDTNQHYSDNVSSAFVEEFKLDINYNLNIKNSNSVIFISNCIKSIDKLVNKELPNIILVIGDTNSTLAASIVANKNDIQLAHLEAGIRCGDKNSPEEINRILVDDMADIHFTSRIKDKKNVSNSVYVGDLEYVLLNQMEENDFLKDNCIEYQNWILMTIHRKENLYLKRITKIFDFCEEIDIPIVFPIHHATEKLINDKKVKIPNNIKICEPKNYMNIIKDLTKCKGVITDSGGITKICPYFGKKCIIPMGKIEWKEVIEKGYGTSKLNHYWFDHYQIKRNRKFYYLKDSCKIILKEILR